MSISRKLTTAIVTASVAAGSLLPLTTAAHADGWRHRDHGNYAYRDEGPRDWDRDNKWQRYHKYEPRYTEPRYAEHRRHRHRGDGKAIALGLTALVIGAMIASAARENEHRRYRD